MTAPPLLGIYAANTSTSPARRPDQPNLALAQRHRHDAEHLPTSNVYTPVSLGSPQPQACSTTDAEYQKIMRLYNWNYVVDNLGTTPCDWRIRFFGTDDNTKLFNSRGAEHCPEARTYTINYNEILRWIAQSPNPFPTQLRAGRVKYYGSIPTSITGTWPSYGSTDQRFWVEFIDYVLGFRQTSAGVYRTSAPWPATAAISPGGPTPSPPRRPRRST